MEYIALKCEECGLVSIFPRNYFDGYGCIECDGIVFVIGDAKIYGKRVSEMNIDVKVNTKQLDKALKKAEKLAKVVADLNMEINNLGNE